MAFFKKNTTEIENTGNILKEMVETDSEVYVALDPIYEKYKEEIDDFILENEELEAVYPLIIDYLCITNKRLIFVDKDLKDSIEVVSVPYKNICDVGLLKGSVLKLTNELKITTRSKDHKLKFIKGRDVVEIYNRIVEKIID